MDFHRISRLKERIIQPAEKSPRINFEGFTLPNDDDAVRVPKPRVLSSQKGTSQSQLFAPGNTRFLDVATKTHLGGGLGLSRARLLAGGKRGLGSSVRA